VDGWPPVFNITLKEISRAGSYPHGIFSITELLGGYISLGLSFGLGSQQTVQPPPPDVTGIRSELGLDKLRLSLMRRRTPLHRDEIRLMSEA
jgi:hypothetical protein